MIIVFRAASKDELFDLLGCHALDDRVHVDALEMDTFWFHHRVNNLVCFNDGQLGILCHGLVEVVLRLAKGTVAESVGFVHFDQGDVTKDGLLQDVALAPKVTRLSDCRHDCNATMRVISYGKLTGLHYDATNVSSLSSSAILDSPTVP